MKEYPKSKININKINNKNYCTDYLYSHKVKGHLICNSQTRTSVTVCTMTKIIFCNWLNISNLQTGYNPHSSNSNNPEICDDSSYYFV